MKKYYLALVLTLFVLSIFAQNIPSYVPKDGLVGWWPFNGNANDESGNENHGITTDVNYTSNRNESTNSSLSFYNNNSKVILSQPIILAGKNRVNYLR